MEHLHEYLSGEERKKEKELMLILVTKAMDAKREAREALETETRRRKALKYKKNKKT